MEYQHIYIHRPKAQGLQVGNDGSVGHRSYIRVFCLLFPDKTVRLWLLRPSVEGGPQEEVAGWDAVLDGTGGDIPPALWHRGEYAGEPAERRVSLTAPRCLRPVRLKRVYADVLNSSDCVCPGALRRASF